MRKIILGLMFAFYLGGLVGCAELATGDGRDKISRREAPTGT